MRRRALRAAPRASCRITAMRLDPSRTYAPAALRALLSSRGKPCGLSPPRGAWRPSIPRTGMRRIGPSSAPPHRQCSAGTPGLAAAGCANACRLRRWRFVACVSRRTVHGYAAWPCEGASSPRIQHGRLHGMGCVPTDRWGMTLPGAGGMPLTPSCGDATGWPWLLPDVGRPRASLCCRESWRWCGLHACNLPAQIISPALSLRSAHSSRDKLFGLPGAPLRCARKRCSQPALRRSDHNKDAMGANLVQP